MDDICRLCCSTKFVSNSIFDEENALYLKMSLYLPIKVFKNDRLPQKICDKCSCKVNDFYQFCNETIEVQARLRALLSAENGIEETIDLSIVKNCDSPPPNKLHLEKQCDRSTQTEINTHGIPIETNNDQQIVIKKEPTLDIAVSVKQETDNIVPDIDSDHFDHDNVSSDSEDISLITLKSKKSKRSAVNGEVTSKTPVRKGRKKKVEFQEWDDLMTALPEGAVAVVGKDMVPGLHVEVVKEEMDTQPCNSEKLLSEFREFNCCICLAQCYNKTEMLKHYKQHDRDTNEAPPAPPPPDQNPVRCSRCQKTVAILEWAAHWRKHWERDRRPYRCSLCDKTFRDVHRVLKHGETHNYTEGAQTAPINKRFVCDLCPEGFVYMRYLLSHRTRAHPEASGRAVALRCAVCARTFAHVNSLRRHLRSHSGERNFLCNVCGKALSSREHLKYHIRIHTGYKPNVCKTCGKGFVKKCNLTLHERVHSGEKPHVCSHCGKAFSQRSTLVIHERYHSGARPYVCSLCGRGFVAKGLLSMHLKTTCI